MAPHVADKTICLDPDGDIADPHGQPPTAYRACADRIHTAITRRLVPVNSSPIPTTSSTRRGA
jgi:hypothetical protein